jgi:hypothetical protein
LEIFRDHFTAQNIDGDQVSIDIFIGGPVRVQGAHGEHTCAVSLTGLINWNIEIFGASSLQAAELALFSVRSRLSSMENAWKFFDSEGLHVSFGGRPGDAPTL